MNKHLRVLLLAALALSLLAALPAVSAARSVYKTSAPVFSESPPLMGQDFTVSGVITPASTTQSKATVKVKLLVQMGEEYDVMGTYTAKLAKMPAGTKGTKYSRTLNIPTTGAHAVQVVQYRRGKAVSMSKITYFDVQMPALQIHIDSMVNGWLAPSLGDTMAPADTPLDIVFSTPSDWASEDPAKHYGAAHFIWGDFEKVGADGLTWHTDGLRPGRYDWMRDAMPKWGTGSLVVAQQIDIDKNSHADTHALPYLPADISFGDVSSEGMGCDRSIAFVTRIFAQTSPDPLVWHTDGLVPARYDWKCWMDECCYGALVADPAATVTIASDPDETITPIPANTPLDIVFTGGGSSMMCWRTMYFTTAGDFTKTSGYPGPLTWRTGGLAPGIYEWQCWMGPGCHHGTVVAQYAATAAGARITYTTSKAVLSNAPKKDRAFTASGFITPKSTASNRAKVKIILWMKYGDGWGVMDTYWAKLSARSSSSTRYSVTITIPMKGDHGVQAVQYRKGKVVSKSATKYFDVQP